MNGKKLANIQYLRGIAALMVCGFHTQNWLNNSLTDNLGSRLFPNGEYGVEIFFMISGFIMIYTTRNYNPELAVKNSITFLKKRIVRIVPLYTILTFAWIFIFIPDFNFNYVNTIKILKSLFFIPYKGFPILYLGWTLNYEMLFYLIFAFTFLFKKYRIHALITIFVLQFISQQFEFVGVIPRFLSNYVISFFFIGIISALLVDKIKIPSIFGKIKYLSYLLLILMNLEIITFTHHLLLLIFIGINCFIIITSDFATQEKVVKPLFFLGNISFSLYLIHPFVPNFLMSYLKIMPGFIPNGILTFLFYIIMLSVIIGISFLSYKLIEEKFNKLLIR